MSGPTIRIHEGGGYPEVTTVQDVSSSFEIGNLNDFDLGLLGNQRKMVSTPPRGPSPAPGGGGLNDVSDGIEFVNLDDTNVTYNVKPMGSGDSIRILRDEAPMPLRAPEPTLVLNTATVTHSSPTVTTSNITIDNTTTTTTSAPAAPAPAKSWFSSFTGGASTAAAPATTAPTPSGGFSSWFGGAKAAEPVAAALPAQAYLSPEVEATKKLEGLTILERMDRKGVGGNKMTVANSLEEIEAELARRKDSKGLEASMRFQRSMLTTVTSGMEFLNSRYDPIGVNLDGWSEQINENIEDYDEIFEELYDKYKDKSKVAPEVRLIMSLGLSAAMCHVTNTMFKSRMPGMDDILRKNPELARQMAKAAAEQAVGPGFANFMGLGMPGGGGGGGGGGAGVAPPSVRPQMPPPQRQRAPSPPPRDEMEEESIGGPSGFMAPMGSGVGAPIPSKDPRGGVNTPAPVTARREMRGPDMNGLEDVLRTLETNGERPPARSMPPPANDVDDNGSITSGVTTETMRRNGVSRRRRQVTPTGNTLTLNV
jgi:hypothetical protein